jgi:hypothetical protein
MMSLALNVKLVLKSFDHIDFIGEIAYLNWLFRSFYSSKLRALGSLSRSDMLWIELLGPKNINRSLSFISDRSLNVKFIAIKFLILLFILVLFIKWV